MGQEIEKPFDQCFFFYTLFNQFLSEHPEYSKERDVRILAFAACDENHLFYLSAGILKNKDRVAFCFGKELTPSENIIFLVKEINSQIGETSDPFLIIADPVAFKLLTENSVQYNGCTYGLPNNTVVEIYEVDLSKK